MYSTFFRQGINTVYLIALCLALPYFVSGQITDYQEEYGGTKPEETNQDSILRIPDLGLDTINFHYFYPHNPKQEYPYQDTFLNDAQVYHPARSSAGINNSKIGLSEFDYANTGNLGGANRALIYQPGFHQGIDIGFHQFDLYKTDLKKFPYYRLKKAFTNVTFTQGSAQEDTYFKGQFSRNFANRINLSIDLKRINHKGQFLSQKAEDTAFGIGLWYRSPKNNYDGFLTFISNTAYVEDNGGIDTLTLTPDRNIEEPFSVPVFISNGSANTAHTSRGVSYFQHLRLNPMKKDSSIRKRAFAFSHLINFHIDKYKFSDTSPDTTFYGDLQVDNRGLRYFVRDRVLENTFTLNTYRLQKNSKGRANQQRDFFEVGLHHQFHDIRLEPSDKIIQNLYLNGRWNFSPNDRLRINTYAHLGLAGNAGDYRLSGDLFFDLKKVGQLEAKAINQLFAPSLVHNQFFVSQEELWNNDFNKTFETSLALTYRLPKQKFEISGHYHLLTNFIYFDSEAKPQQIGEVMNIGQLVVQKEFKFWKLHLKNRLILQESSQGELRLPNLYSSHSFFYQGKIFKRVLDVQLGFDFHVNNPYFGDTYQHMIGQFHLQDNEKIESYPDIDAFMNFKVKWFRFFLKMENVYNFFSDDFYYQVHNYPMPYQYLRFGVSWQFID